MNLVKTDGERTFALFSKEFLVTVKVMQYRDIFLSYPGASLLAKNNFNHNMDK